jgi:hypothetical protein
MRPPQRTQTVTSTENTLRNNTAQSCLPGGWRASPCSFESVRSAADGSMLCGSALETSNKLSCPVRLCGAASVATTSARHSAAGANRRWNLSM